MSKYFLVKIPSPIVEWWNHKWSDSLNVKKIEECMRDFLQGVISEECKNQPRTKAKLLDQLKLWNLKNASK